jgi:hypothetical protein
MLPGSGLPSPALVVAAVALLVALGGTASATGLLGPCGYLVCRGDIGTGAVDDRVVKDRSLGVNELSTAAVRQLRSRPDFEEVQFLNSTGSIPANEVARVTVSCPSGHIAIGGGGTTVVGPGGEYGNLTDSYPSDASGNPGITGWTVWIENGFGVTVSGRVDVTCAPV